MIKILVLSYSLESCHDARTVPYNDSSELTPVKYLQSGKRPHQSSTSNAFQYDNPSFSFLLTLAKQTPAVYSVMLAGLHQLAV